MKNAQVAVAVAGAKFTPKKKRSFFFRPTAMSVAMAHAGIIPGTHMVKEVAIRF